MISIPSPNRVARVYSPPDRVAARPLPISIGSQDMNKDAQISALADFIAEVERLNAATRQAEDRQIYGMYLARVAIILSKVIRDEPIGDDIASMERLFGNTWLKDEHAYREAYSTWDRFKGLLIESIQGMTVNERLFNLGLLDQFDDAAARGDKVQLRSVLFKCFLEKDNIEAVVNKYLKRE